LCVTGQLENEKKLLDYSTNYAFIFSMFTFCLWLTLFKNNFIYESKCDANVDVVFLQQSLNVLDAYHYIPINQNLLIATVMHEHLN